MAGLVEVLREDVGDDLRVVAQYDRDGYDVVHHQSELHPRIEENAADIHRELVLQGIGRDHLERLFEAGPLHCSMHRFEELTAFHFVRSEYTGIFISIDSQANVDLVEFTTTITDYLDGHERPVESS